MKLIETCATLYAAALLTACVSTNPSNTVGAQTPAEIAAQVCPALQTTLSGLNALVGLPLDVKADLAGATPIVAAVCAAGNTVNFTNLQTIQRSTLPALTNAVHASGISIEQQNNLILDLTAAQLLLTAVVPSGVQANQSASVQ